VTHIAPTAPQGTPARTRVRAHRSTELGLGIIAIVLTVGGYILTSLAQRADVPADLLPFLFVTLGLLAVAHVAVRRFAPRADETLLPIAALLSGTGFIMIARLNRDLARIQSLWMAIGVVSFVVVLAVVRRVRDLERFRYTFMLLGVLALVMPALPGIGREINGARLWVRLGPMSFQPGEAAKVLLVVFLAAYLVDKRELLGDFRRVGILRAPDPRHLAPVLVAWGLAILVMVQEKDLGSSMLFFAVFVAMLYMATERAAYVGIGGVLFVGAAFVAYQLFGHVQVRVSTWVNPWRTASGTGFQIVQSLFALGSGGMAGTGLGLGSPSKIPAASTDFIFAAIGEELGLIGATAILIAYILLIGTGYRIAVNADQPFTKLLAAGLTTILGVQTFIIVGGVTRLIPLTGITLPFISFGGSSLIANFVILALLLRISDDVASRAEAGA
jgi:peptidoglycan glycosyltransferase